MANHHELSNFIWQIADLLRGPYRPPQYERVMLPMTVLRRFDCVLEPTKQAVLNLQPTTSAWWDGQTPVSEFFGSETVPVGAEMQNLSCSPDDQRKIFSVPVHERKQFRRVQFGHGRILRFLDHENFIVAARPQPCAFAIKLPSGISSTTR